MGAPTDNDVFYLNGSAWEYKYSKVYFDRQGYVVGWKDSSKIFNLRMKECSRVEGTTFTEDSTEAEVLTAMGPPTTRLPREANESLYCLDYGYSKILFHSKDSTVYKWVNSDGNLQLHMVEGKKVDGATFALGSSKTEVVAATGIPTDNKGFYLEGSAWEYKYSKVYFDRQGYVVGWEDSSKIFNLRGSRVEGTTFTEDSTEAEVLTAMGPPTTRLPHKANESNYYWAYGNARVHFKDGKVYRWEDSNGKLKLHTKEAPKN